MKAEIHVTMLSGWQQDKDTSRKATHKALCRVSALNNYDFAEIRNDDLIILRTRVSDWPALPVLPAPGQGLALMVNQVAPQQAKETRKFRKHAKQRRFFGFSLIPFAGMASRPQPAIINPAANLPAIPLTAECEQLARAFITPETPPQQAEHVENEQEELAAAERLAEQIAKRKAERAERKAQKKAARKHAAQIAACAIEKARQPQPDILPDAQARACYLEMVRLINADAAGLATFIAGGMADASLFSSPRINTLKLEYNRLSTAEQRANLNALTLYIGLRRVNSFMKTSQANGEAVTEWPEDIRIIYQQHWPNRNAIIERASAIIARVNSAELARWFAD